MMKCFVITPIGEGSSDIRRHIDGIIDQSIVPALKDKYEVEVAHRKFEIGSINDRVIKDIYSADLVIANLTSLNPNVMFELAMRYSFAKPAIVIAEDGTKLPFDIVDENTIFYINDPAGANDLKNQIRKFEENIDYAKKYGPIYKAISTIPLYEAVETKSDVSSEKMLSYVIDRLNNIENYIGAKNEKIIRRLPIKIVFRYEEISNEELRVSIMNMLYKKYGKKIEIMGSDDTEIRVGVNKNTEPNAVRMLMEQMMTDINNMGVSQLEATYFVE